jgi:hypothetical protein
MVCLELEWQTKSEQGVTMLVRKVRGQDKVGKVIMSKSEVDVIRKMGIPVEKYIEARLVQIAKKRGWKWYFNKREVVLGSYGGHHDRVGFVYKDTGLPPTQEDIDNKEKNDRTL